ncbi:MAG: phage virion morphogenesis protein [Sphingomonas sanxanigenens]|uniref:Phage virion morphogenesis protein n=1 Tax=Sphingomonas sanxanigenens TaxID=397260 RepID=A0A2W5A7Z0_9SPHN|nr:MAG: phage virion morphogenesis protein [Sphingomonas sanxanigenens]
MAGVAITVRAAELPHVEAVLARLLERNEDLHPLMDVIGQSLETSTDMRFEDERGPDGRPWKKSIRAEQQGGKTLTDSTRLRMSITHEATADEVRVGTNVIYARPHQFGAKISGKGGRLRFQLAGGLGFRSPESVIIPARPFLGVSTDDETEILALAEDYEAEGWE